MSLRACGLSLLRLLHVVSFLAMDRGTQNRGSPCHWSPACLHSGVTQGVSLEFSVTLPPGWLLTAMVQPWGGFRCEEWASFLFFPNACSHRGPRHPWAVPTGRQS